MGYNVNYLYAYKSSENTKFSIEMPMSSHIFIDDKIIDNIKDKVHENQSVKNAISDKNIVKEIYVKNKIYNIVVK